MMMKSSSLYLPFVMAVMSALAVTASPGRTASWTTTETPGQSLNGKMFTLSRDGGISFYPPNYYPTSTGPYYTTNRPYYTTRRPYYTAKPTTTATTKPTTTPTTIPTTTATTKPTTTPTTIPTTKPTTTPTTTPTTIPPTTPTTTPTTRPTTTPTTTPTTHPWTTAPATRGVSVCLRYLTDDISSFFTLSPSRSPLKLSVNHGSYSLEIYAHSYYTLFFEPNLKFWSNIEPDIWTRVCLTVDAMKNVAQMFSGSNISVRKMLPTQYVWSGEPVIDFSGFDGQLTDVQIWDYPLRYKEVFNYMTSGVYAPYRGSALSWSHISYSPRGRTLLEDTYEWKARQPISSSRVRKGRRPKGGKKTWAFSNVESRREQL